MGSVEATTILTITDSYRCILQRVPSTIVLTLNRTFNLQDFT
jgi:hypothetical protein